MRRTLFLTLFLTVAAHASGGQYDGLSRGELKTLNSEAFLNAHPDMKYRLEGWIAFEDGRLEDALAHFDHASRYGDKLSQAMLAEMHWEGRGVPRDRALAYAWADLAAERGYPRLVVLRERYWEGLDEGGQARAIEAGQALYAEYGDEVAQPRMARHLRGGAWRESARAGTRRSWCQTAAGAGPGSRGTTSMRPDSGSPNATASGWTKPGCCHDVAGWTWATLKRCGSANPPPIPAPTNTPERTPHAAGRRRGQSSSSGTSRRGGSTSPTLTRPSFGSIHTASCQAW